MIQSVGCPGMSPGSKRAGFRGLVFGVWGLGFRVQGLGFGV